MLSRFVVVSAATVALALAADVRVIEEIAAKVNGDIITRSELEQTRRELEQALKGQGVTGARLQEQLREAAANALRDQIDQLLLVQRGKDLTISVDGDVTREMADLQVRSKITDPDKFHEYVRENTGMSYEDYRDRLKRQFLAQRVIGQEVGYRINFPEPELRKYYDEHPTEFVRTQQVYLSQILISTEGKTAEQAAAAETKAKELVARARKGEKFSDLVRDNSDHAETARSGGSLPPLTPELLDDRIRTVVFKENKGYITDPFKTAVGYLILRIDERHEAGQASFDEVRSEIQEKMARPQMEPKIREYLTRLRLQAFLEIKEGYIDSGAAAGKDTRWRDVAQLRPQTTTKEEVAARTRRRKKLIFVPIPGTIVKEQSEEPAVPAEAPPASPIKK
jgi:peptidyl-prolyl cis-trans isomerase SurA